MKVRVFKPFVWLGILLLIVSLACNATTQTTPEPTEAPPVVEKTVEPVEPSTPTEAPEPQGNQITSGAVGSLEDVESAVIQIEAEGTFVDPEVGWQVNVGKLGSGFIISPDGIAVTNNHVVTGAALLRVWVGGDHNKTYNAKVLGVSECSDLAVIDIDGDGFPYMDWYAGDIKVGLKVFAAGFPFGDPNYNLTDGIVSKDDVVGETSWASVDTVIEHSAKINPGNSGGPLVTEDGQIVGVNYAGVSSVDINMAIGRDEALEVIDQLKAGKDVDTIGVNGGAVSGQIGDVPIYGVWVRSVASGSPADKAGIEAGDIIYQLEEEVLSTDGTMADYCDILRSRQASDTMNLTVIRFDDLTLLEGQLNGDKLEVTGTFAGGGGGGNDNTNSGGTTGDFVLVVDDTSTIQMEVPAVWTQIDGRVWSSTWGDYEFDAPSISASTDFELYNQFAAPGVFFAASDRWGQIGGYANLLSGAEVFYESDCERDRESWRVKYDDGLYEGMYNVYKNCGSLNTKVFVLGARPKVDKDAFLILVEIRFSTDSDLDALVQILKTFKVIGEF
jgi:serine protease Do